MSFWETNLINKVNWSLYKESYFIPNTRENNGNGESWNFKLADKIVVQASKFLSINLAQDQDLDGTEYDSCLQKLLKFAEKLASLGIKEICLVTPGVNHRFSRKHKSDQVNKQHFRLQLMEQFIRNEMEKIPILVSVTASIIEVDEEIFIQGVTKKFTVFGSIGHLMFFRASDDNLQLLFEHKDNLYLIDQNYLESFLGIYKSSFPVFASLISNKYVKYRNREEFAEILGIVKKGSELSIEERISRSAIKQAPPGADAEQLEKTQSIIYKYYSHSLDVYQLKEYKKIEQDLECFQWVKDLWKCQKFPRPLYRLLIHGFQEKEFQQCQTADFVSYGIYFALSGQTVPTNEKLEIARVADLFKRYCTRKGLTLDYSGLNGRSGPYKRAFQRNLQKWESIRNQDNKEIFLQVLTGVTTTENLDFYQIVHRANRRRMDQKMEKEDIYADLKTFKNLPKKSSNNQDVFPITKGDLNYLDKCWRYYCREIFELSFFFGLDLFQGKNQMQEIRKCLFAKSPFSN